MSTSLPTIAHAQVLEKLQDGVIILDPQGHVVEMNPAAQMLLGSTWTEARGRPFATLMAKWPDQIEQFCTLAAGTTEIVLGQGSQARYYQRQITPLYDMTQALIGHLLILHDITAYQQVRAQQTNYAQQNARLLQEEQHQRKIAEGLRQTMLAISRSLDHNAVVEEILTQVRQLIPYDSAGFFLQKGDDLCLTNGIGFEPTLIGMRISLHSHNQTVQAFQQRQTRVIANVRLDPHWVPTSAHEPIHSCIAAPLVIGDEALGILTIDRFEPQAFTEEDAQILQLFANQAALAFKNAQLHQQAQTAAALEERNRLAQDLHDAINQTLFSAAIIAEALPDIWDDDPVQGKQVVEELRLLTQTALAEMRALLLELRPAALIEKNFGDLLRHLVKAFANRTHIPVDLVIDGDCILPPTTQLTFYRIAQEALANIMKHARATQATLHFAWDGAMATLSIQDNGRGFDSSAIPPGHFGVTIMLERAQKIGAHLTIASQPTQGSIITLHWQTEG